VISDVDRATVADALDLAEARGEAIEPPTSTFPAFEVEDAYWVQLLNIQARVRAGDEVRGHKVGLTSRQMQEMLGVDEPDYGHILRSMLVADGDEISTTTLCQPRAEIEIAFFLHEPLRGPGVTADDVLAATEAIAPAIEVIDSRIRNWTLTLADTVADNASSARVVLGDRSPVPADLPSLSAVLRRNDEVMESGVAAAVLENPANAVAWLANKLAVFGSSLEAGHVVMPGACTRAVDVTAGDTVTGEFAEIGSVSVRFT
jgi:2-keto-4-pentenoate hydratase